MTAPTQYPALPQRWVLDGLAFQAAGSTAGRYLEVKGWHGQPSGSVTKRKRTAGRGAYTGSKYHDGRVIEARGVIRCMSPSDVDTELSALERLCTADGPQGRYPLEFYDSRSGRNRMAYVFLDDDLYPEVTGDGLTIRFDTQLYASDPRMWSPQPVQSPEIPLAAPATGGVRWNGSGAPGRITGTEWNGSDTAALNLNPGFEYGVSGWGAAGGTLAQSATYTRTGGYSGRLTPDGTADRPRAEASLVGIRAGAQYAAESWWLCPTGHAAGVQCNVAWYDTEWNWLGDSASRTVALPASASTWTRVFATHRAPANAAYAELAPTMLGTPSAATVSYVDDATLKRVGGGVMWQTGSGASGVTEVVNEGTTDTPITLSIRAESYLTRPTVRWVEAQREITFNGTLSPGDTVEIDSRTGFTLLNGESYPGALSPAQLWELPPGRSTLLFTSAALAGEVGFLTTRHHHAYLGG